MARLRSWMLLGIKCLIGLSICLMIFSFIKLEYGLRVRVALENLDALLETKMALISSFLIASGIVLFVIAILGCYGAILENHYMVLTFSVLMTIVLAFQLYSIVRTLGRASKDEGEDPKLKQNLNDSMRGYESNEKIKTAWDGIQESLECCGVDNYTDWGENIPNSCCKKEHEADEKCPTNKVFKRGCWKKMMRISGDQKKGIGIFDVVTFFFNISTIAFACFMANLFKKQEIPPEQHSEDGEHQQIQPSSRDGENLRSGISTV